MLRTRPALERLLEGAGIRVDGDRPWDMQVHDPRVFRRLALMGSMGLGEAYMDGWWDCQALDGFAHRVMAAGLDRSASGLPDLWDRLRARLFNLERISRAFLIGQAHYDLGNELYEAMLGPRMTYSCGYWKEAEDLESAQDAKHALIGHKLHLEPGMSVLDVGCGWGEGLRYMATAFGARGTGLTVSKEQADFARSHVSGLPLEIRLEDYRRSEGRFDRVYSVGMFEHVGVKNYRTFMRVVRDRLEPDGLFVLHTIGHEETTVTTDPWIARYIFPNSMLPSVGQLGDAAEGLFVLEDWHNFGADYDHTLLEWYRNFEAAWPTLRDRFGERFRRMWRYYLLMSAGGFRARRIQLWQIVLSPAGVAGGYRAPR